MNRAVEHDMSVSSRLFQEQVWPLISGILQGGDLIVLENRPDVELARLLDMSSGVDALQIHKDLGIRGIASRVQPSGRDWGTFTVRKERDSGAATEYAKRLKAIASEGGWLYPYITVQAYAKTEQGPIISVGVTKTEDLIECIRQEKYSAIQRTSNAEFYVCRWRDMRSHGFRVFVTRPDLRDAA